jgi:anionic cell wall polymer biosynthesis LytR-Cps2A-Psr (LCP) family protein
MLIRTGGGHAARLSIPRDTVLEIPGHGLQKINAAHEFG